jgi:hypothetical protein
MAMLGMDLTLLNCTGMDGDAGGFAAVGYLQLVDDASDVAGDRVLGKVQRSPPPEAARLVRPDCRSHGGH